MIILVYHNSNCLVPVETEGWLYSQGLPGLCWLLSYIEGILTTLFVCSFTIMAPFTTFHCEPC